MLKFMCMMQDTLSHKERENKIQQKKTERKQNRRPITAVSDHTQQRDLFLTHFCCGRWPFVIRRLQPWPDIYGHLTTSYSCSASKNLTLQITNLIDWVHWASQLTDQHTNWDAHQMKTSVQMWCMFVALLTKLRKMRWAGHTAHMGRWNCLQNCK
jgi:hypothetical protein